MFARMFNLFGAASPDPEIYKYDQETIKARNTESSHPSVQPIHPMLLSRQSLRSMDGKPVSESTLMTLFEAARWAPSHFNCQNWRFVYAKRDTPQFQEYLQSLWDRNQTWAKDAGVLVVAMSKKTMKFDGKIVPVATHSFEAGSAWMSMALEGCARGLVMHAMGGFFQDKIRQAIGLKSDNYQVECIIAIGNRAKRSDMPERITQRLEVDKFISEGTFTEKLP